MISTVPWAHCEWNLSPMAIVVELARRLEVILRWRHDGVYVERPAPAAELLLKRVLSRSSQVWLRYRHRCLGRLIRSVAVQSNDVVAAQHAASPNVFRGIESGALGFQNMPTHLIRPWNEVLTMVGIRDPVGHPTDCLLRLHITSQPNRQSGVLSLHVNTKCNICSELLFFLSFLERSLGQGVESNQLASC